MIILGGRVPPRPIHDYALGLKWTSTNFEKILQWFDAECFILEKMTRVRIVHSGDDGNQTSE